MVHLYQAVRLHVNYFQPSFKLLEKIRDGARVIKRYSPPATPCDRLMQGDTITAKPESTEGGGRVSALKRREGAPVLLG